MATECCAQTNLWSARLRYEIEIMTTRTLKLHMAGCSQITDKIFTTKLEKTRPKKNNALIRFISL